jgi:hypothetical protein
MPRPEVRRLGGEADSRYVVISQDHYWSGVGWTEYIIAAKEYDDEATAAAECETLVAPAIHRFTVPLKVIVDGEREFTPEELRDFLGEYVIAAVTHDPACMDVCIDWDGLKEIKPKV